MYHLQMWLLATQYNLVDHELQTHDLSPSDLHYQKGTEKTWAHLKYFCSLFHESEIVHISSWLFN